ncbi:MAG: carboxylating nicotinate-nucleotide diphosphorylase [bacterium]
MPYLSHKFIIEKFIKQALREDIGHGDITVDSLVKPEKKIKAAINSRSNGIIAGINILKTVFEILDPEIECEILVDDSKTIKQNQDIAFIKGNARAILTGERTALNFLQRMSAIATMTDKFQKAIFPYKSKITDTRKTTPNFRIFEKYSVKAGGGSPHRFGLYDCVMIKDNHIKLAGSITDAIKLIRENISHTTKIEVEAENIDQVIEALKADVDIIMLDNMSLDLINKSVDLIQNKVIIEASGNISLENVKQIASTGVDFISTSVITANAGIFDIGLDL